jgi:serine/threonine protein kinase
MEYIPGGNLYKYVVQKGRRPEDEARNFFQQIIAGVEYCHIHQGFFFFFFFIFCCYFVVFIGI